MFLPDRSLLHILALHKSSYSQPSSQFYHYDTVKMDSVSKGLIHISKTQKTLKETIHLLNFNEENSEK